MENRLQILIALIVAAFLMPGQVSSQTENSHASAPNPLAKFDRLVGGRWHLEGSYQEFEWGVGHRSIIARSYFLVQGEPQLVSEGIWYWHPEEKRIKGVFTAINMPIEFFEYTTRFEGNSLVSELAAYDAEGNKSTYTEMWEFVDESHFVWTLFVETPEGPKKEMGGTYSRNSKRIEQMRSSD
ncbi:MAG: hypothetical protein ACR2RD_18130 [Woeseiaceae bacterium]